MVIYTYNEYVVLFNLYWWTYYVNVNCVEQNLTRCSINQQIPKAVLKDKGATQSSPISMADVTL